MGATPLAWSLIEDMQRQSLAALPCAGGSPTQVTGTSACSSCAKAAAAPSWPSPWRSFNSGTTNGGQPEAGYSPTEDSSGNLFSATTAMVEARITSARCSSWLTTAAPSPLLGFLLNGSNGQEPRRRPDRGQQARNFFGTTSYMAARITSARCSSWRRAEQHRHHDAGLVQRHYNGADPEGCHGRWTVSGNLIRHHNAVAARLETAVRSSS